MDLEELCPGVYYGSAAQEEYYIVIADTPNLSARAKGLGRPLAEGSQLLVYPIGEQGSGYMAVRYELLKYRMKLGLPLPDGDTLCAIAAYGMFTTPEYFGQCPAPTVTPRGATLRYRQLMNGVFELETDRLERMLSVCYPIWKGDLLRDTVSFGEQTEYDLAQGIDTTFGPMFFTEQDGRMVLSELKQVYKELAEAREL